MQASWLPTFAATGMVYAHALIGASPIPVSPKQSHVTTSTGKFGRMKQLERLELTLVWKMVRKVT